MVLSANMSLLMGHHMLQILPFHLVREVNLWPENSKDKWRIHCNTLVDIVPENRGRSELPAQGKVAGRRIQQQNQHAKEPYIGCHGDQDLQRIGTVTGIRCEGIRNNRVNRTVQSRDSGCDLWRMIHHDFRADGLGAGDQA